MSSSSDRRRAFTLTESLIATFLVLYIISGTCLLYSTMWTWWHEISPKIEAQKLARTALLKIITGNVDSTAGTDSAGGTTYKRRHGIAWAVELQNPSQMVDDDGDAAYDRWVWNGNRIDFRLESDLTAGDKRSFYVSAGSPNILYYYYNVSGQGTNTVPILKAPDPNDVITIGFEYLVQYNMIIATVTVQKKMTTATGSYSVTFKDYIHMRNI